MARDTLASLSFAHLMGARASEDEQDPDDKGRAKRGRKAEEDDNDPDAADPDDKDPDDTDPDDKESKGKGKRGRRADDDDGDDEDMEDDKDDDAKAARARERARCAAIFRDKAAGANPALAASIAFGTALPRSQALNLLRNGAAASAAPGLAQRMRGMEGVRVSSVEPPQASKEAKIASSWDAAGARAGIKPRG